jgi:hypothetical protein
VKSGFEATPNLDSSRKNVGLEVFEKIYEKLGNFSYNSWLDIEAQCSMLLEQIYIQMRDKLKRHNVDSV